MGKYYAKYPLYYTPGYISIDSEIYRGYISPDWIGFGVNVYEHFCNKMTLAMDTGTL